MSKEKVICIPAKEYQRLKGYEKVNKGLLAKIARGLEDIKAGRVHEWK